MAILRVLSSRSLPDASGFCCGARLTQIPAINRLVGTPIATHGDDFFGAGVFPSCGLHVSRADKLRTSFTVEERFSEALPRFHEEAERFVTASVEKTGPFAGGRQYFVRAVQCPVFITAGMGTTCDYCSAAWNTARGLLPLPGPRSGSEPLNLAHDHDVTMESPQPNASTRTQSSGLPPSRAYYGKTPTSLRRVSSFSRIAKKTDVFARLEALAREHADMGSRLRASERAVAELTRKLKLVVLPPDMQRAVLHLLHYHDPSDLTRRLASPYMSPQLAAVIRWWIELERLRLRTGKKRLRTPYPACVVDFCLEIYHRDSALYNTLIPHMHIPSEDVMRLYTPLCNVDGSESAHTICALTQCVERAGNAFNDTALLLDEVHLVHQQSVHGGVGHRTVAANLAPQCSAMSDPPAVKSSRGAAPDISNAFAISALKLHQEAGLDSELHPLEDDSASVDDEPAAEASTTLRKQPKKQLLAFTIAIVSVSSGKFLPLKYVPVTSMQGTGVFVLVRSAIALAARLGLVIVLIFSDGAAHFTLFRKLLGDTAWCGVVAPYINFRVCGMLNPFLGLAGPPILVGKDLDHVEKRLWIPLTESGSTRRGGHRVLWYDSDAIVADHFDALLALDRKPETIARAAPFLRSIAVNPTGGAAMRPQFAKQFFDAGAGALLPALAEPYASKPLPERRSLVRTAQVCAAFVQGWAALMSRGIVRGCPSANAAENHILYDPKSLTLPGGAKQHGSVRASAVTRENLRYVWRSMDQTVASLLATSPAAQSSVHTAEPSAMYSTADHSGTAMHGASIAGATASSGDATAPSTAVSANAAAMTAATASTSAAVVVVDISVASYRWRIDGPYR